MKKYLSAKVQSSLFFSWFICSLAALFYTYEYLLRIEPGIMVQDLQTYFALSAGGLGLLASMYYWAYTPLQLVVGLITDRFGARRVLISAILFCIIGTWIFGLTNNYIVAAAARFLTGFGSAFAFVGALKLAADWLPKKYFSIFVGLCTSLGMLGAMFGETAMSWIVDHLSWHPVIIDSVWLGVILLGIFFMFVYEKHELNDKKHDVKIINFHALKNALLKIISSRMIWQAGFIGCALYLSLSLLAEQWGNTYIQKIIHGNAESASIYVDMIFFGWFIGSPLHGYLSEKFASRKRILIYGSVSSLLAFLPLILWPTALSHLLLGTLLFLFGFFSSAQINCFAVARDFVETQLTATAVGFMNACVMVGGMIIQPLYGFTLDALSASDYHTMHVTMRYTLMDYRLALIIIPIFILLALIIACLMKDSYKKAA
ncbi:MAG: MFS transporter [Gammaproteobacteria bacterium CG_4_10_14_0_8_um_filter_38_16]|nr:MAG: MFS transporter [Gammaproteobacteria bacterium CG_4_10_14_0_8_um_filter_38_16]PJA03938.1 MAG: MFS transporter [Gammaproteobacteria bacterium CG_4_10_14_0_2_um_filter_38_22]PJB09735.1 MAG: MFS transporter [Gammaproteobacteria bacterium CG_4_9_14_3_um_filter_38_9]